jgi:hypothetical protein
VYRSIDTAVWDDPWFADLEPDAKLFFLYLITNDRTNASGAYEVTVRQMAFETGLDAYRIDTLLTAFDTRIEWYPEHHIIWVRNFYRHNCHSPKMTVNAQRHVARLPAQLRQNIGALYPDLVPESDRVSIPYQQAKAKALGKAEAKAPAKASGARGGYAPEFEIFWQRYPRKEPSKKEASRSWLKVMAQDEPPEPTDVMAGLERWLPVWAARGDPEKVPHATTWLNQERWTVITPAMSRGAPNGRPAPKSFSELAQEAERERARGGHGAGHDSRPLLADPQERRERPGADAADVDADPRGRVLDALHRERP